MGPCVCVYVCVYRCMMLIHVGFIFTNHLSLPCVRSFVLHGNGSVTWLVNEYSFMEGENMSCGKSGSEREREGEISIFTLFYL